MSIKCNGEYVGDSGLLLPFLKGGREGFAAVVFDDLRTSDITATPLRFAFARRNKLPCA